MDYLIGGGVLAFLAFLVWGYYQAKNARQTQQVATDATATDTAVASELKAANTASSKAATEGALKDGSF